MNQRPFSPITGQPFRVENYYFQIILNRLIAKRPLTKGLTQYTFTVYKANQKCQSTRPLSLQIGQLSEYSLQGVRVNFVAINYNPSKNLAFAVRMIQNLDKKDKEIGEYVVDANHFIDRFVISQNGAFTLRIDFNEDCAADIELYVQRSRYGVQRIIRELKNPKPNIQGNDRSQKYQNATGIRKKIQLQLPQKDQQISHSQKFTKFSPKRDSNEGVPKKEQFSKNKQQLKQVPPEIKKQVVVAPTPFIEAPKEKKAPKTEFVPKKQWMIPSAQKYLANKKNISKKGSIKEQPINQEKPKQIKAKANPVKKVQESEHGFKQPSIQPKYLIIAAILFVLACISYQFIIPSTNQPPPPSVLKIQKTLKPKKSSVKSKLKK